MDVVEQLPTTVEAKRTGQGKWLKGVSGNPSGKNKVNEGARQFKALLANDAQYLYNKCRQMLEDPDEKGKAKILTYLIDRLCGGKVAQVLDVTTTENPLPTDMTGQDKIKTYLKWCEDTLGTELTEETKDE
jgi:hypothetical protein